MKFYINKYPIITLHQYNGKDNETLPEGLAFTIDGISNMGYSLKPVKKLNYKEGQCAVMLDFSPEILKSAFNEVDFLPE